MREIILLGGPAHGARFQHEGKFPPNALEGTADGGKTKVVYLGRKFVSLYPIPGWEFDLLDDNPFAVKPWNRVKPYWHKRLFSTEDYAVIIERALVNLTMALAVHDQARKLRSETECAVAESQLRAAVSVLLALTSGDHLDPKVNE